MSERNYPYEDGDTIVLGPEVFADESGHVICWKGRNYVPQAEVERLREALESVYEMASTPTQDARGRLFNVEYAARTALRG